MAGSGLLRGARGGSRNVSPLETGTTWVRPRERGRSRETGPSHGYLAPAGGARRRRSQLAGRLGAAPQARPLHLVHGGALSDSAGRKRLARPGTPATAGMRAAMIGDPAEHGRGSRVPRLGTRAACPARCAASIRCPPSWAMASRPRPDPRPACRPPRAITGMVTRCCLPARHENVLQALLCTTMWITCVKRRRACARLGGNAGDRVTGRARNRAFTWGSAINALWTEKAPEFVHTPRRNSA